MALVLIGFMGAGKSTLAGRLAALRGRAPIDGDALLVERFGHSVAREFELHGERAFRAAEEEVMCGLLESVDARDVIALGGGSVLSARVRATLTGHTTALIEVAPEIAWERVHRDGGDERPLAHDRDAFLALHAERSPLYEQLADATLLWARSASGDYPVLVGRGLLRDASRASAVWPLNRATSRSFSITDETVWGLYGERLGEPTGTFTIPPGESHKTLASAERAWTAMADGGVTRADHVVALGGGVVGDLAGFCAATYQRGVPVVHVPTTLVAQVDSAYGGKTGVDLPAAKNYVGAYHQPAGVLVDPALLDTLPPAELAAGWVEVLKTALIAGGNLWERVSAGGEVDERTILACARTKLAVVSEDERDAGARQALNLGHTVGHAIETVTRYARYRHGEAVGLGLLAALRLSGLDDLRAQVRELLRARDLPVSLSGSEVNVAAVVAATARDKKRTQADATVPFVLLDAPGEVRVGCEVQPDDLLAAVQELLA
ncbi:MAG TPA: bifunctional shikimate kinase/3-dehydroquinate synthase [Solirubrobacteraceae bacterium]